MEKDKLIREMANDIAFIFVERMTSDGIRYETIAEMLIDMDYRKVPEGSVVLTKEEYENLANQYRGIELKYNSLLYDYRLCKDANETLKKNVIAVRKKISNEIFSRIEAKKDAIRYKTDNYRFASLNSEILRLEKEFGFVKEEK